MAALNPSPAGASRHGYQELSCVGRGSQGSVYTVRHVEEGTTYVLKRMHIIEPDMRRAALLEAETLQRLQHPTVVGYRDTFVDGEYLSIVMEYCEGGDLASRIEMCRERPFAEEQILQWLAQLVLALHHTHERGVLHRDFKTQNVFLSAAGHVKLGDFGISKSGFQSEKTLSDPLTATVIGTPYYMSPELFRGEAYGGKADVWALGCVLYEMVARRRAFQSPNMASLSMRVMRGDFGPLPPSYSTGLHDLVKALLTVNPSARPSPASLLSHPLLRRHVAVYADATLGPHSEGAQLASPALAALRAQLHAVSMAGGTPRPVGPQHSSSVSMGGAPSAMLSDPEDPRVENALRKLEEERRWRHRERRACRALGPASSHAQHLAPTPEEEENRAPPPINHKGSSPKLSPKPSPPAPCAPPPPPLHLPPSSEASTDWVGGDAGFREQFSLSRNTLYGRRAGEPRSVGRQPPAVPPGDGLGAGRWSEMEYKMDELSERDERSGAHGGGHADALDPLADPRSSDHHLDHLEPSPSYADYHAAAMQQAAPPELTLPHFELPGSLWGHEGGGATDGALESFGEAADFDDCARAGAPSDAPLISDSLAGLAQASHSGSARERVLARREIRKRAEAAAREDELLHARQRYFQERVLASHAQRSQYCGHFGSFIGAGSPKHAMRA